MIKLMLPELGVSFEDEPVIKFSYDILKHQIDIHFGAYIHNHGRTEIDCIFTIKDWSSAKSRILGESKYEYFDKYMGVFSMIYSITQKDNTLELTLDTIDNRYLELWFENPKIEFLAVE